MERKIYNPKTATAWTPAKEWVELSEGSWVCVWELSVPESLEVGEAAQRHPQDPRPGANEKEAALWLLAYSCRDGDGESAGRIFSDLDVHRIYALPPVDFTRLLQAARGLLESGEEAEERARDFTAGSVTDRLPSPTGASRNSTGSPAS